MITKKNKMLSHIIVELLCLGVKCEKFNISRSGGAGPAEGISILIENQPVMVPVGADFVQRSPYHLNQRGNNYYLMKDNKELFLVDLIKEPAFYNKKTKCNVNYNKIALLHGKDCLASTVYQKCIFWKTEFRCKFCGIELSLKNNSTIVKKMPHQLAEVSEYAVKSSNIKHILLTTGLNGNTNKQIEFLADCASAIKKKTGLRIHTQFCPPDDLEKMWLLKESGVDSVGIHIESMDLNVLTDIAPGKAKIGIHRYTNAWKKAVEIFGVNQVSSFLLCGIGEKPETLIDGGKYLSDMGVYPFVVPLRPIPKTCMANYHPPTPSKLIDIYEKLGNIVRSKGLNSGLSLAGCLRCGACSAIRYFEN